MNQNDFDSFLEGIKTLNPNLDSSHVTIKFAGLGELSPEQWQTFGQALVLYKNLEMLCLPYCLMQFLAFPETMCLFGGTLAQLKTLQCLDIRKTGVHKLSSDQLELLYSALTQSKNLRRVLGLESCSGVGLNAFYAAPLSPIIVNIQNDENRPATIYNRRVLLAWCASIAKFFIDNRLPSDNGAVTKIILDFLSPPKIDRRFIEEYLHLHSPDEISCHALGPMLWQYNDEPSTVIIQNIDSSVSTTLSGPEREVEASQCKNNLRKNTSCCTVS